MSVDGLEAPAGDGWRVEVRYWRSFICACGYMGKEYHVHGRENTMVCTKCFNGRLPATTTDSKNEGEATP